jgi:mannitol-specific phosphotransferase system IIBC component
MAVVIGGALLLSACATTGATGPMTPAQQQLHDSNTRYATTAATGVVVGAVGGALIGYLAGGTKGALIGAGAGAVAGGVAGFMVAQNNYQQSRTEQNFQAAIADAQQQSAAFRQDAVLSEAVASQARATAARLQSQLRANSISAAQYRASLVSYETTINDLDAKNAAAAKEMAALQQSIDVTPAGQAGPLVAARRDIDRDNRRISAAKDRLRRLLAEQPASA